MKKFRDKMRKHPILSILVTGLVLYALLELFEVNIIFEFLLIFIVLICVKRQMIIKNEKDKIDYLAKKIAEENANKKDPQ